MVKVTIEYDEGTEVLESEAAFVVCMTGKDNSGKKVDVKTGAWGDLPEDKPQGFLQAAGDGIRNIVRAIGTAGVKDAELHFLVGFVGNPPKKVKGSLRDRIRRFFGRKEDKA